MSVNINEDVAFVMKAQNVGSSSILVHFLTKTHGIVSIKAKGFRAKNIVGFISAKMYTISWQTYHGQYHFLKNFSIEQDYLPAHNEFAQAILYANKLLWQFKLGLDDTEDIFSVYTVFVQAATQADSELSQVAIRKFEWLLIRRLGYNFNLQQDVFGNDIKHNSLYVLEIILSLTYL